MVFKKNSIDKKMSIILGEKAWHGSVSTKTAVVIAGCLDFR